MQVDQLLSMLDSREEGEAWLASLGIVDTRAAHANLMRMASAGVPLDLLATICEQLTEAAPRLPDPDMAFNNLERFLLAARSPLSMAALFERDARALPNLLQMLANSQHFSDQLCADPENFDLLRMSEGRSVAREVLVEELVGEVRPLQQDAEVRTSLRLLKRRETLRIAYGDLVEGVPIAQTARQISYVADAVVEAALDFAQRRVIKTYTRGNGKRFVPPKLAVLALGKLGGLELNYSSDIDLLFLWQTADQNAGAVEADFQDYANRVAQTLIRLLTETTDIGFAYRVDMRLRPEGRQGPICSNVERALTYYDRRGRTWERQAYVKARPIAGDLELGRDYLARLQPWVYRRYLTMVDITGIKALKRRIEERAQQKGNSTSDVKCGQGGIRDVEFVIQFLQLLSGGSDSGVRETNTIEAIGRLEQAGGLTHLEKTLLEENYCFLRKLEHRLQIMCDLQTHQLPRSEAELAKVARRMGFVGTPHVTALEAFQKDYEQRTEINRKILDHLLHDAFGDDAVAEPEVDLVNDPDPDSETIEQVLGRYPFDDWQTAYTNLMSLAEEPIPFLSTRRCRMFLAAIAPRLLASIAATPAPDGTLVTLTRVSDSLGGKAALWELFSSNHATLNLYVTLCAACPYLSGILTSNPGMIDELLDSLLIGQLPGLASLETSLEELIHGAEDEEPILHSFKYSQHLRIGVRDIMGKDDVEATHAELSDVAEVCLHKICAVERGRLLEKLGRPTIGPLPDDNAPLARRWHPGEMRVGEPCDLIVLALGKLGGREPNYHSDLDLVFLYEAEGQTLAARGGRARSTSNNHFFSELGQRIIKRANHFGPYGRLYEVDPRLRPTGRNGTLAVSLEGFIRYFEEGGGQLWERQALCKARVIHGESAAAKRAMQAVAEAAYGLSWQPSFAIEIREMRLKLQETASPNNLKRTAGGTMDTEFIVQMLQLQHGRKLPEVRQTGTLAGLTALQKSGVIAEEASEFLSETYRFQRSIEARLRLMDATGRHEFPEDVAELNKLAYLLGYADADRLRTEVSKTFGEVRKIFLNLFELAERA